jgi:vesicle coat complex subunit
LVVDELCAFVRKSVRAIGQIAIEISEYARSCVDILAGLIGGKVQYATEEAVCDLIPQYPEQFESILISVVKILTILKIRVFMRSEFEF